MASKKQKKELSKSKEKTTPKVKTPVIRERLSKQVKEKDDNIIARIKVVGVGGAGGNAISRMYEDFPRGVELIAVNTDIQDLQQSMAKKKVYIGKTLTRGLGTGMNPEIGKQAAEESRSEITEAIKDADMVFIAAGMGGGTGTGAAPVVAEIAKELGILTVAIVTKPFGFEGGQRARIAEEGIIKLRDRVDTIITIPNDRIFSVINKDTSLLKAFEEVDKILRDSVKGITELILTPGMINIDFADIKTIMRDAGAAMVGIGIASGQGRAAKASAMAINSPLLETSIEGARGILYSISGRSDLKMQEINEIASAIAQSADPSAKIIFGNYYDRKVNKGQLKITIIATGFSDTLIRDGRFVPYVSHDDYIAPTNHLPFEESDKFVSQDAQDYNNTDALTNRKNTDNDNDIDDQEKNWDIPAFLRRRKK